MICPRCKSRSSRTERGQGRDSAIGRQFYACNECDLEWEYKLRRGRRVCVVDGDENEILDTCAFFERNSRNFGKGSGDEQ